MDNGKNGQLSRDNGRIGSKYSIKVETYINETPWKDMTICHVIIVYFPNQNTFIADVCKDKR